MAHLGGVGGASKFLREGGEGDSDTSDTFGTTLSAYGKTFSNVKDIDFEKVSETFNPFAGDDGRIQVASADPNDAFRLFAEKQKQIGGGEFGGTPSNLSLASQMKNLGETQVSPNVGGTSGRLQDFRGGDPFKPLRGAGIGGSNMGRPDNVTDISTPASRQLTGPTTSNYGTQDFNAYGEGVTPGLRQGEIPSSPTGLQNFNTYSEGVTPGLRQGEIPPSPSGAPVLYDAFGNTTVFQGREGRRVDTGIPLSQDPTTGSLAYGARNVQDQLDAATSEYASNTPRPYSDPGAYTFAAPFGRQDAMGQFPSGAITQAPSSIPAPTGFNFVETERDRVRAGQPIFDQRDTITQESDRLRELGRQEEARRMQSDRGFIPTNIVGARPDDTVAFDPILQGNRGYTPTNMVGARPDDVTRFETPYQRGSYDASFPREPAVSALGTQPVGTQMLPNDG